MDKRRYQCSCGKSYVQKSSLVRHKLKTNCLTWEEQLEERHKCELQAVRDEAAEVICKIRMDKDNEIAFLRGELSKYREELAALKPPTNNTINNINNGVTITTAQIKRMLPDYSTANPLTTITDMSTVLNEDDELFMENIAYDHKKKILHETLGNGIVDVYKMADPKEQAIWNTDSSRLNYLIKHAITKKKSSWIIDKKGLHVTKRIIAPVLDYLRGKMDEYMPNSNNPNSFKIKGELLEAMREINDGELGKKINRYIASHLYMPDNVKKAITHEEPVKRRPRGAKK